MKPTKKQIITLPKQKAGPGKKIQTTVFEKAKRKSDKFKKQTKKSPLKESTESITVTSLGPGDSDSEAGFDEYKAQVERDFPLVSVTLDPDLSDQITWSGPRQDVQKILVSFCHDDEADARKDYPEAFDDLDEAAVDTEGWQVSDNEDDWDYIDFNAPAYRAGEEFGKGAPGLTRDEVDKASGYNTKSAFEFKKAINFRAGYQAGVIDGLGLGDLYDDVNSNTASEIYNDPKERKRVKDYLDQHHNDFLEDLYADGNYPGKTIESVLDDYGVSVPGVSREDLITFLKVDSEKGDDLDEDSVDKDGWEVSDNEIDWDFIDFNDPAYYAGEKLGKESPGLTRDQVDQASGYSEDDEVSDFINFRAGYQSGVIDGLGLDQFEATNKSKMKKTIKEGKGAGKSVTPLPKKTTPKAGASKTLQTSAAKKAKGKSDKFKKVNKKAGIKGLKENSYDDDFSMSDIRGVLRSFHKEFDLGGATSDESYMDILKRASRKLGVNTDIIDRVGFDSDDKLHYNQKLNGDVAEFLDALFQVYGTDNERFESKKTVSESVDPSIRAYSRFLGLSTTGGAERYLREGFDDDSFAQDSFVEKFYSDNLDAENELIHLLTVFCRKAENALREAGHEPDEVEVSETLGALLLNDAKRVLSPAGAPGDY